MISAMYSSISGMNVNQSKLNVIANNVANAGTTAFKSQRATAEDMMSQTKKSASAPSQNLGGTNGQQVGLGAELSGIDTIMETGTLQPTGRPLDMALDGEVFFMTAKGPTVFDTSVSVANHGVTNNTKLTLNYTKDGNFKLDQDGNLLTSDGQRVLGYDATGLATDGVTTVADSMDTAGKCIFVDGRKTYTSNETSLKTLRIPDEVDVNGTMLKVSSFSIEKDGTIKADLSNGSVSVIGQIATCAFKNPEGLMKEGKNKYVSSANSGAAVLRSGVGSANDNSKAYGDVLNNTLEMGNVDLAAQFTDMIVASRAFQACSKGISTSDEILQDIINVKR